MCRQNPLINTMPTLILVFNNKTEKTWILKPLCFSSYTLYRDGPSWFDLERILNLEFNMFFFRNVQFSINISHTFCNIVRFVNELHCRICVNCKGYVIKKSVLTWTVFIIKRNHNCASNWKATFLEKYHNHHMSYRKAKLICKQLILLEVLIY